MRAEVDRRKSTVAEANGWRVLRVRQALEPLTDLDVIVGRRFAIEDYVAAVVAAIRCALGR